MGSMEFALIIAGAVFLVISFAIPARKSEKNAVQALKIDDGMMKELVEKELKDAKSHMNDMAEETLNYSMEKTERALERMTNEKIMAINEYSDQVLTAINKNHQEVMFLYDMLSDKHTNLVNTVSEASQRAKEIRQTVQDAEITVKEAVGMMAREPEAAVGNEEKSERMDAAELPGLAAGERNAVAEPKEPGRAVSENVQGNDEAEFIPISPKRVELVQDVLKEGELPDAEAALETDGGKGYNNERILRLHKLGKSKTAIARELGLGVGEVKLVIDLFEQ